MTTTPETAARVIGSATIAFGLIPIPVKIYSANKTEEKIELHNHHAADNARLKQQYICTVCGVVVDRENTVKGYEHAKGQTVMLSATEIETLDAVATNTIALEAFVRSHAVDTRLFDTTYYLGPDKGSERAYQMFANALTEAGHVAIGMHARRGKEKLVALWGIDTGDQSRRIVMHELHFVQHVRSIDSVPGCGDINATHTEVELAKEIIHRLSVPELDYTKYTDNVQRRVMSLIEAKIAGGEIVATPAPNEVAPAIDLLDALRASLDSAPARAKPRDRKARIKSVAAKKARASKKTIKRRAAAR